LCASPHLDRSFLPPPTSNTVSITTGGFPYIPVTQPNTSPSPTHHPFQPRVLIWSALCASNYLENSKKKKKS
jgi:hypothetical protein